PTATKSSRAATSPMLSDVPRTERADRGACRNALETVRAVAKNADVSAPYHPDRDHACEGDGDRGCDWIEKCECVPVDGDLEPAPGRRLVAQLQRIQHQPI